MDWSILNKLICINQFLKCCRTSFFSQWDLLVVVVILCSLMMMDRIFCLSKHTNNSVIRMCLSAWALWWSVLPSGFVPLVDDFEIIWIKHESWKWHEITCFFISPPGDRGDYINIVAITRIAGALMVRLWQNSSIDV